MRGSARYDIPVFAKLSPEVTDIVSIARACVSSGADGLSLINTMPGMVIDPSTLRPALAGLFGGLSGPAIRPLAVRCVWQVREAFPTSPSSAPAACGRAGTRWSSCWPARRW